MALATKIYTVQYKAVLARQSAVLLFSLRVCDRIQYACKKEKVGG